MTINIVLIIETVSLNVPTCECTTMKMLFRPWAFIYPICEIMKFTKNVEHQTQTLLQSVDIPSFLITHHRGFLNLKDKEDTALSFTYMKKKI